MRKKKLAGRLIVAIVMCSILLLHSTPLAAYAGFRLDNGRKADVISHSDDAEDGLFDTSYNGTYFGEDRNGDGYRDNYSVDISEQLTREAESEDFLDVVNSLLFEEQQNYAVDLLSELIYLIASALHAIFDTVGIALDNIIFGRVSGYGTLVDRGISERSPADDTVVSLFHFELEKGNPYGVIAAMIYSEIRKYMYLVMIVVAFIMFVRIAVKSDNPMARMDFKDKLMSVIQVFAMMIFMPYFLEGFLYVRDIMLKGIIGDSMVAAFGGTESGFLNVFRENCRQDTWESWLLDSIPFMASVLYLAAVCISLVLASMYVANSMAMMIQVIAFPVVCVKALFDKKAVGGWILEVIGLAAVPLMDGVLLFVPLLFNKAANGSTGMNFISLLACGCMLTVRQQFRRALGIQSSNALETGGLMTAMGMARLIGSIGRAGRRAVGQVAGGISQGASDDAMANYYEAQAAHDDFLRRDAEAQIDNGYFNARGGIGENPAATAGTESAAGAGLSGDLAYRVQQMNRSREFARYEQDAEAHRGEPGYRDIIGEETQGIYDVSESAEHRAQDVREAQISAVLGRNVPVRDDDIALAFATPDNFESQEFANRLSNASKAELYRQRAQNARRQGLVSGLTTAAGAVVGGTIGFAATAYMDSGTSAMVTSAGIDLGVSTGNAINSAISIGRQIQDANAEREIIGEGAELSYVITQDADDTDLFTYNRFSSPRYGAFHAGTVDSNDLPAVQPAMENGGLQVTTQQANIAYPSNEEQYGIAGEERMAIGQDAGASMALDVPMSMEGRNANVLPEGVNVATSVTIRPFNEARDEVVTYMQENPDVREIYENSLAEAIRNTWNNSELRHNGGVNYARAEAISQNMQADIHMTPEERAVNREQIATLRSETYDAVFSSLYQPTMREIRTGADDNGIIIPAQEMASFDVVTREVARIQTEHYIREHGWNFDSLMME